MLRSLLGRLRGSASGEKSRIDDAEPTAESGADGPEAADTNDVWDLIPSREYDGKYVESGGQARGEQERALRDIQRQAAEIERSEDADEASGER
ncbi:hypothetical protein GCM10028857_07240 [Salinarchaeum chitinilyticum]